MDDAGEGNRGCERRGGGRLGRGSGSGAARRFFTRALTTTTLTPVEVTTDQATVYQRVLDELTPGAWHHTEPYANNRIEAVRHEVARNEWITRTGGRYRSTA
jgi:transposase-like protein